MAVEGVVDVVERSVHKPLRPRRSPAQVDDLRIWSRKFETEILDDRAPVAAYVRGSPFAPGIDRFDPESRHKLKQPAAITVVLCGIPLQIRVCPGFEGHEVGLS